MNVHDWTRVDADQFHSFHHTWIAYLKRALKTALPEGFYAVSEGHIGRKASDVLGLHRSDPGDPWPPAVKDWGGAVALLEHPPAVEETCELSPVVKGTPRTLAIRHGRGHRIVALIEIVSNSNKNTESGVREFVDKTALALRAGIHVAILDLLPPTKRAPDGLFVEVEYALTNQARERPAGRPLSFASFRAWPPTLYLQTFAVGQPVPTLPLFLTEDRYVQLPLAATYEQAFADEPGYAQELLTA